MSLDQYETRQARADRERGERLADLAAQHLQRVPDELAGFGETVHRSRQLPEHWSATFWSAALRLGAALGKHPETATISRGFTTRLSDHLLDHDGTYPPDASLRNVFHVLRKDVTVYPSSVTDVHEYYTRVVDAFLEARPMHVSGGLARRLSSDQMRCRSDLAPLRQPLAIFFAEPQSIDRWSQSGRPLQAAADTVAHRYPVNYRYPANDAEVHRVDVKVAGLILLKGEGGERSGEAVCLLQPRASYRMPDGTRFAGPFPEFVLPLLVPLESGPYEPLSRLADLIAQAAEITLAKQQTLKSELGRRGLDDPLLPLPLESIEPEYGQTL